MINFLTLSLKCKKLKLILSILFLLSFCFTKSQKETLTINIPKNLESIRTGYPVYHITANTDRSKLYFYNKLNAYSTGLYIYGEGTTININQDSNTDNDIDTTIGDCIYNPYKNHFLISQNGDFGDDPASIKVIRADLNNSYVTNISLTDNGVDAQYPKRMFIAPNEKLYVMANMHYFPDPNNNMVPKVFVYNANDDDESVYTLIQTHVLTMPYYIDEFDYYSAHFCYNPHNQLVYATIHPTEITLDPYQTVPNSMFDFDLPIDIDVNGLLIKFEDNQVSTTQLLYPGKIICPDIGDPEITSQYDNKLFIIGKRFYVYDYYLNQLQPPDGYNEPFNDITYSAFHDKLFAIKDVEDECSADRKCEIDSIDYENNNIVFNCLGYIDGQASSIFSNPYDANVYIYNKFDDEKLGGTEVKLFYFDPCSTIFSLLSHNLGITSFYPELDHCPDYGYRFYNITTPYIDPYNNYIYLPNGGHSCVSKVFFETNEALLLNNGEWAWLSFPRLDRDGNDPVVVNDVLYGENNENIDPNDYINGSRLENLPPNNDVIKYNIFNNDIWQPSGELSDIQSTLGYKLKLDYYPQYYGDKWLHLKGNVLDPTENITIFSQYDNWVGYWLYETQSPFDAIPDNVLNELTSIKAQFWSCVKEWHSPEGNPQPYWMCACHQSGISLNYGDMVILRTNSYLSFQWQRYGNPPASEEKSATEYYQYNEQADYTSFFVELDTTANPLEIGAFVGDSCIGASTVLTNDTIVLVPGYIEGMSGDVTFEEYYDSLKSNKPAIKEYLVNNNKTGTWEKRIINTVEKQDYYFVSFKNHKYDNKNLLTNEQTLISCLPNPFKDYCTIEYFITVECNVQIVVYDLYGKSLNILQEGVSEAGNYSINWTGTDSNGKPLPNGVYILKLRAGTNYAQTKVVILR